MIVTVKRMKYVNVATNSPYSYILQNNIINHNDANLDCQMQNVNTNNGSDNTTSNKFFLERD